MYKNINKLLFFVFLLNSFSLYAMNHGDSDQEIRRLEQKFGKKQQKIKKQKEDNGRELAGVTVRGKREFGGLLSVCGFLTGAVTVGIYQEFQKNRASLLPLLGFGTATTFLFGFGFNDLFSTIYHDTNKNSWEALGLFARLKKMCCA
jgi:hypothetical protein